MSAAVLALDEATALRCARVKKAYPLAEDLRLHRVIAGAPHLGRAFEALRGVTLSVPKGRIVGVLGRNGAGKSTLLRVLGGVSEPTGGEVAVQGTVAGLFEMGAIGNPNLSGREYARRYLRLMGVAPEEIAERCAEICAFAELESAFDDPVRTYSSGMAARLSFAAATSLRADVYLVDELLAVGDEHFQAKCWTRMRALLRNGASGVLVTHDWPAVLRLCEEAHVIEQGRIAFSGASHEAVVRYLALPPRTGRAARFAAEPQGLRARAGEDARLRFTVEILEAVPVEFAFAIEVLEVGVAWEILLLEDGIPVAQTPGRYHVDITIPRLPLAPGRYCLGAFLARGGRAPGEAVTSLDARTWTRGDAWVLEVEGEAGAAAVRLPYRAFGPLGGQ